MKKEKKITATFEIYASVDELVIDDQKLMAKAKEAISRAYAPYSNFYVGAAVLMDNGKIVTGNNQENAAYPSGMCAERVAIWSATAQYPDVRVLKIAIAVHSAIKTIEKPVAPCGACRQTLLEYEKKQKEPIEIFFTGEQGEVIKTSSLEDLLPFSFDQSYL